MTRNQDEQESKNKKAYRTISVNNLWTIIITTAELAVCNQIYLVNHTEITIDSYNPNSILLKIDRNISQNWNDSHYLG